jgi:hypothetical protein
MNMCSKCYKDLVLKQSKETSAKAAAAEKTISLSTVEEYGFLPERSAQEDGARALVESLISGPSGSASENRSEEEVVNFPAILPAGKEQDRQPNRCMSCRKRVGLTGFKCRCGNTFCSLHRYSDKHNCSYDYKSSGREAIAKANPVVKADKVDRI